MATAATNFRVNTPIQREFFNAVEENGGDLNQPVILRAGNKEYTVKMQVNEHKINTANPFPMVSFHVDTRNLNPFNKPHPYHYRARDAYGNNMTFSKSELVKDISKPTYQSRLIRQFFYDKHYPYDQAPDSFDALGCTFKGELKKVDPIVMSANLLGGAYGFKWHEDRLVPASAYSESKVSYDPESRTCDVRPTREDEENEVLVN